MIGVLLQAGGTVNFETSVGIVALIEATRMGGSPTQSLCLLGVLVYLCITVRVPSVLLSGC